MITIGNKKMNKLLLRVAVLVFSLIEFYFMYLINEFPEHENGWVFWLGAISAMYFFCVSGWFGFIKKEHGN